MNPRASSRVPCRGLYCSSAARDRPRDHRAANRPHGYRVSPCRRAAQTSSFLLVCPENKCRSVQAVPVRRSSTWPPCSGHRKSPPPICCSASRPTGGKAITHRPSERRLGRPKIDRGGTLLPLPGATCRRECGGLRLSAQTGAKGTIGLLEHAPPGRPATGPAGSCENASPIIVNREGGRFASSMMCR
jgi:hypothetical protein